MANIVFKLCEILLLLTLITGAPIATPVNYGVYLGNVPVNSIKYDWNMNYILNGMY